MKTLYRFTFPEGTERALIEAQLAMAISSAEFAYGEPAVKLSARYYIAEDKPLCLLEASSPVGEHIVKVFTGFMTRGLGEESFCVERIEGVQSKIAYSSVPSKETGTQT